MARALYIGSVEQNAIDLAVAKARLHPVPWSVLQTGVKPDAGNELQFKDRPAGWQRPPSVHVELPGGFRAAISFEEQPAGLCRHLSVSIDNPDPRYPVPHPVAFEMIARAFGFDLPVMGRIWREEFAPGEWAINLIAIEERNDIVQGHA